MVLELVAAGEPLDSAAREVGTSSTQISRLRKHNPAIDERFVEIEREDAPQARVEFLRAQWWQHIKAGDYKALRDALMIFDPNWEVLRTQRFEHTVTHQDALTAAVREAIAGWSPEQLESKIRELEALPPEQLPVIEARMLPPAA